MSARIIFRLGDDEAAALDAARGEASRSKWLRQVIRAAMEPGATPRPEDLDAVRALTAQVQALGRNVNQIARALNSADAGRGGHTPDAREIREAAALVADTVDQLEAILARWSPAL